MRKRQSESLIRDFILFFTPFPEKFNSHRVVGLYEVDAALGIILVQFFINMVVLKSNSRCIMARGTIINGLDVGPINGGKAHRAWLAGCIQHSARQIEIFDVPAGIADSNDFGMGRRIIL